MNIYRSFEINIDTRDDKRRTVEASISSEAPVERWDGIEILIHDPSAVDLSRAPLPLIVSHDSSQTPVGIVECLRVVDRKLRGLLRFGNSTRACEVWADVQSGIIRNLSIGYQILKKQVDGDVYRAVKWVPFEVSLVAVPADNSVGIGRSYESEKNMTIENENENKRPREIRRALHVKPRTKLWNF